MENARFTFLKLNEVLIRSRFGSNVKLIVAALILSVCAVPVALAQVGHGTVGVIHYTKAKIVVEADSRETMIPSEIAYDDRCKIIAMGKQSFFFNGGLNTFLRFE